MRKLPISRFSAAVIGAATLVAAHARTCAYIVEEPRVVRATHAIKSIQLVATDDSGTCRKCRPVVMSALTEYVERLPSDGSIYVAVLTFGSVSRVVFSSPVNSTTKPLILTALKTLPVPNQRYTHPDEALKGFAREIASLFNRDRAMYAAWKDGQIGLRAALIWDSKLELDPRSRTAPIDFEREAESFRETYATSVTSMVLREKSTAQTSPVTAANAPAVNTVRITATELAGALMAQRDSRWPVPQPAPVSRPVIPRWLIGIDGVLASTSLCWGLVVALRRSRERHRHNRTRAIERHAGEWRYRSDTQSGTFALDEHRHARFGPGGDHLRHLPSTFRVHLGRNGVPQVEVERGEIFIAARRLRAGQSTSIGTVCQVRCDADQTSVTVELRRVGNRHIARDQIIPARTETDLHSRRLA